MQVRKCISCQSNNIIVHICKVPTLQLFAVHMMTA